MRGKWFVAVLAVALAMSAGVWAQSETSGRSTAQDVPKQDAKQPAPPVSVTIIGARDAHGILGREVRSAADENMGRIVDAIVDRDGVVRAAVIISAVSSASAAARSSSTGARFASARSPIKATASRWN